MGIDVLRFVQHFLNLTNGKIIESDDDAFSDHRRFDRRVRVLRTTAHLSCNFLWLKVATESDLANYSPKH